jgi:hypothetical protein
LQEGNATVVAKTPKTSTVGTKSKKGVFKNSGRVLSEEQQESELTVLNPMARPVLPGTCRVPTKKHSYLNAGAKSTGGTVDDTTEDEETSTVATCTNSTGTFVPPYWCFVFTDIQLRSYVCVTINIPSGLCSKSTGLENVVDAKVSACRNKLEIACSWPETLTAPTCMENALSVMWSQHSHTGRQAVAGVGSTVSNILLAFELELHKIRKQNKVSTNNMLGATAYIDLPFNVEAELLVCETTWDRLIHSVNLYVVLKKTVKSEDQIQNKRMAVRICDGLEKMTGQVKKSRYSTQTVPRAQRPPSSSGSVQYVQRPQSHGGSVQYVPVSSVAIVSEHCMDGTQDEDEMENASIGSKTATDW